MQKKGFDAQFSFYLIAEILIQFVEKLMFLFTNLSGSCDRFIIMFLGWLSPLLSIFAKTIIRQRFLKTCIANVFLEFRQGQNQSLEAQG